MASTSKMKNIHSRNFYFVYEYELGEFARVTTLHGMARWLNARSISSKLFWAIVVISVVTFSVVQVTNLVSMYMSHPTMTEVRFVVPENGLAFPTVTVCNYNPVKASAVFAYNMSQDVLEYTLTSYMQPGDLFAYYDLQQMIVMNAEYKSYVEAYKNVTGADFSLPDFFWDAGYKCEDMFLSCTFGGLPFNCCQFAEPTMTEMGRCYQFKNFGQSGSRQLLSGSYYGFQAFINAQVDEYPMTRASGNAFVEEGIRFSIQQHIGIRSMTTGAYSVSAGNRIYAAIQPSYYQLLSEGDWGKCIQNWPNSSNSETYSAANCRTRCEMDAFLAKCGCVPLHYSPSQGPICDSLQLYKCIQKSSLLTDEAFWKKRCSSCKMECDRWMYDIQNSYVKIPSQGASTTLAERFDMRESDLVRNVLAITTYYTEIAYTEYIQMQAITMTQTFSNIGGTLGLFIGFSVITFFELLLFIIKVIWGCVSTERRETLTGKKNFESTDCLNETETSKKVIFTLSGNEEKGKTVWYSEY